MGSIESLFVARSSASHATIKKEARMAKEHFMIKNGSSKIYVCTWRVLLSFGYLVNDSIKGVLSFHLVVETFLLRERDECCIIGASIGLQV